MQSTSLPARYAMCATLEETSQWQCSATEEGRCECQARVQHSCRSMMQSLSISRSISAVRANTCPAVQAACTMSSSSSTRTHQTATVVAALAGADVHCMRLRLATAMQHLCRGARSNRRHELDIRQCSSCNALLALYTVTRDPSEDVTHLVAWAQRAAVPAYIVIVTSTAPSAPALIRKVSPPGEAYHLTAQQFYRSVLRPQERQHRCADVTRMSHSGPRH